MNDDEPEYTDEQNEEARAKWGQLWELTRSMIESLQLWNTQTGKVTEVVIQPWDELDEVTQMLFMKLIAGSNVFDVIGQAMSRALHDTEPFKRYKASADRIN